MIHHFLGVRPGVRLYAHLQVRLGLDMNEAEGVIADLEKNPSSRILSFSQQMGGHGQRFTPWASVQFKGEILLRALN
jgi:hypothetical protein